MLECPKCHKLSRRVHSLHNQNLIKVEDGEIVAWNDNTGKFVPFDDMWNKIKFDSGYCIHCDRESSFWEWDVAASE